MNELLVLDRVTKTYEDAEQKVTVLHQVSFSVKEGEFVAVVGPSGSGKSTFLSIAGALLSPTSGRVIIDGTEIQQLSKKEMSAIRLQKIGFIFQAANLVPYLTVRDQLLLVQQLAKGNRKKAEQRADELLAQLHLLHRKHHYPNQLSGGERQRVAIARAFMNDPAIILADEPTASLDAERGRVVVQMLRDEVKRRNKAAVMVTHDERVLDACDKVVYLSDGKLIEQ
ncbi:ABC transporter ATP-binding protein [Anoxybacillus kestanbolensis]|uniref:ABC transporter ATP-binding protein n=1 Tax=Anoxybacillus kestanbolensis TaxID=227476 RepID=UPI003D22D037